MYDALNEKAKAEQYFKRNIELSDSVTNVEKATIETPLSYIIKCEEQQLAILRKEKMPGKLYVVLITGLKIKLKICEPLPGNSHTSFGSLWPI